MLTKKDVSQLKEIFPTKEDLKQQMNNFVTKKELKQELSIFATKDEIHNEIQKGTDLLVKEIQTIISIIGNINEKLDINIEEARHFRIIMGDHEHRIQRVESKAS